MIFLQIVIILLLILLLVRSINHDNRMARLEKFAGRVFAAVRERGGMMSDQIFSGETIENLDDMEEVTADGRSEGSDESEQREDF